MALPPFTELRLASATLAADLQQPFRSLQQAYDTFTKVDDFLLEVRRDPGRPYVKLTFRKSAKTHYVLQVFLGGVKVVGATPDQARKACAHVGLAVGDFRYLLVSYAAKLPQPPSVEQVTADGYFQARAADEKVISLKVRGLTGEEVTFFSSGALLFFGRDPETARPVYERLVELLQ